MVTKCVCEGTGIIAVSLHPGIYSFGPCPCSQHMQGPTKAELALERIEKELRELGYTNQLSYTG